LQIQDEEDTFATEYLEIQVSPLNQPFALKIKEPRKLFYTPKELSFESHVELSENIWKTSLKIPFRDIGKGKYLYGNFHCCLGPSDKRVIYSLWPEGDKEPDFHRPDKFLELGSIK